MTEDKTGPVSFYTTNGGRLIAVLDQWGAVKNCDCPDCKAKRDYIASQEVCQNGT